MVKRNKPPDENKENLVWQSMVGRLRTSLRHIEGITGVARSTAKSILRCYRYHPFRDRPLSWTSGWLHCLQWFIQKNNEISHLFLSILWSDMSGDSLIVDLILGTPYLDRV